MIREVTMYRIECDADGCDACAQDDGEHYAWLHSDTAVDEADGCDWYVKDDRHLCEEHAPLWCDDCDERHEGDCATTADPVPVVADLGGLRDERA